MLEIVLGGLADDVRTITRRGALRMIGATTVYANLLFNFAVPTRVQGWEIHPGGGWLIDLVREHDTALAALPSGHVSLPVCLAILAHRAGLRTRTIWWAWAGLLSISVLSTRQHTSPDLFAGVLWGWLLASIGGRLFSDE